MKVRRKICIVTGTRAEWGLLSPLAAELKKRPEIELQILATNMHLLYRYGHTIDEIRREGFTVDMEVGMEAESDSRADTARATGRCMQGMADAFSRLEPDAIIVLGDRYELLAVVSAAVIMRIPVIHLHGGEISEGAIDDSIRHAITKLSTIHLTSAEAHRQRVIQLGEQPERVFNIGAIGVANALALQPLPKKELEDFIGITVDRRTLLVTYHPVTADDSASPAELFGRLLLALDRLEDTRVVFTYPNNDAGGAPIIGLIDEWVARHPGRAVAFASMGMHRYLSALHYAGAAVGNSSSGIIEVPSMGIPTVNIGNRQRGRLAADSVINCPDDTDAIVEAIARALTQDARERVKECGNPYWQPDTVKRAAEIIATLPDSSLSPAPFYDLPDVNKC